MHASFLLFTKTEASLLSWNDHTFFSKGNYQVQRIIQTKDLWSHNMLLQLRTWIGVLKRNLSVDSNSLLNNSVGLGLLSNSTLPDIFTRPLTEFWKIALEQIRCCTPDPAWVRYYLSEYFRFGERQNSHLDQSCLSCPFLQDISLKEPAVYFILQEKTVLQALNSYILRQTSAVLAL